MNKFTRKQLLKMYGDRRRQDGRETGKRIFDLTSALMLFAGSSTTRRNDKCPCGAMTDKDSEKKYRRKKYKECCIASQTRADPKSPEVQETLQELVAIRKVNRFRDDFPSFAKFKKFLKDEDVSFKEAMEA